MGEGFIPYGAYWSTPFARWQTAFADLHALEFAAWTAKRALAKRAIPVEAFDSVVLGQTVPQKGSFYGAPWFAGLIGAGQAGGPTLSQACATGVRVVQTALGELREGGAEVVLAAACDRVSNSPHLYYPAPRAPGGVGETEDWIPSNFERDPFAGVAMIETAENVARAWSVTTAEQNEIVLMRFAQYGDALADDRAFQRGYMDLPFEVPDRRFAKVAATLDGDVGVYATTREKVEALAPAREGGTVTFAGQTHPADGNAGLVLATRERARELAKDGAVPIEVIAFGQGRERPAFMPAAPLKAAKRALDAAGLTIGDIAAVKSHNPFAVNDAVFARETGFPLERMNKYGCSLIWGHPQGPTGLRGLIELIEELVRAGGGYGLFQGCAAGDTAMAVIVRVG